MHLIPPSNHAPPLHALLAREVRRQRVKLSALGILWKNKIKRIDLMVLGVANKEEPADQMRREGLKRLECIIYGLVDVVRAQHGCWDGVARWGGGGRHLSR